MRLLALIASLIFLAPLGAWADRSGDYPKAGDTASIAAGETVTLDIPDLEVDRVIWAGANSQIQCSRGATLTILDWTTVEATDFFVSQFQGDDTTNDGTTATMGANGPKKTWAAGIAHDAANTSVLFQKGGVYAITGDATFTGDGSFGSYGLGDDAPYGPRPLWNLGATNTLTQTGSNPTDHYHTEISCGDVLTADLVMDRTTAVAPAAIEFKLDVNSTKLPSTEPRLSKLTNGTEIRGGPDFILPQTICTFGDPSSGNWENGARATTAADAWTKNMDIGAVQFHVYESAGTYDVDCWTYYDGQTVHNTTTVVITEPDAEWPAADTWCIADISGNGGNFLGCPVDTDADGDCDEDVSQCIDAADFDVALATTCNIDVDDVRCLFRRGDTFGLSSNTGIVQTDDWEVGAFGTGARPIIDSGSYSGTAITLGEAPNGRIMDLHFVGDNTTTDSKPIYFDTTPSGECSGVEFDNLLISNVLVEDFGNGFNLRGNTQSGAEQYRPECANDNIVIYESAVVNATTSTRGGVDLFMHASSGAILGGDYGNRQSHEHGMRAKRLSDFVIAHADFGRIGDATDNQGCGGNDDGAGRALITIRNGPSGAWEADGDREDELAKVYTTRVSVHDNHIGVCADNGQSLHFESTSNGDDHEHWHSYSVVGNLFNASERSSAFGGGTGRTFFMSQLGGSDIMVANNAYWLDCGVATGGCRGLVFNNAKGNSNGETANTRSQRNHAYNNSFFAAAGNSSTTVGISVDGRNADTFLANNIMTDLESATFISDSGTNTIQCNGVDANCNVELTSNTAFSASITGSGTPSLDWFKLRPTYTAGSSNGIVPDSMGAYLDTYQRCGDDVDGRWEGSSQDGGSNCLASWPAALPAPFLLP
jgi:hypothetical protein